MIGSEKGRLNMPTLRHCARICIVVVSIVSWFGLAACDKSEPQVANPEEGHLTRSANAALQRRETKALIIPTNTAGLGLDIPGVRREFEILVATVVSESSESEVEVRRNEILTWRGLSNVERLSRPERPRLNACSPAPAAARQRRGEAALALAVGSASIYGVDVEMQSLDRLASLSSGRRYIFLALACDDYSYRLAFGPFGVIEVQQDGSLTGQSQPSDDRPFHSSMLRAKTFDHLKQLVSGTFPI